MLQLGRFLILVTSATVTFTALAVAVAGEYVPPPLGETPLPPNSNNSSSSASSFSPLLEVVRTFPIPYPEDVAIDPNGTFFVSGTNDGYVSRVTLATGAFETIFTPRDFRPGFFANATDAEIQTICDGGSAKEKNCGRVLGVTFEVDSTTGACKSLWMANAYFGIYQGSCDAPWTLTRRVSIKGGFVNAIAIAPTGKYLYYTITHGTKQRYQLPTVVLDETAPAGSLHRLDTEHTFNNDNTEQLASGLYFANGLAISTDEESIYVAETTAARILRYDLSEGTLLPFLENLPVLPDNLSVYDGDLLVPGYTRNATMEALLTNGTALKEFHAQDPEIVRQALQAMVAPHGNFLIYEEATGILKERIFQGTGGIFSLASSAQRLYSRNPKAELSEFGAAASEREIEIGIEGTDDGEGELEPDGYLVGSFFVPAATWFRVIQPTNAPTESPAPTTASPTFPPTLPLTEEPTFGPTETGAPPTSDPTFSPTSVGPTTDLPTFAPSISIPPYALPPPSPGASPGASDREENDRKDLVSSNTKDDEIAGNDNDSNSNTGNALSSSERSHKVPGRCRLSCWLSALALMPMLMLLC